MKICVCGRRGENAKRMEANAMVVGITYECKGVWGWITQLYILRRVIHGKMWQTGSSLGMVKIGSVCSRAVP